MEELTFHLEKVVKAKTDDLEDFTGPLDLILSLLSKNKMEIKDIQISLILEQYLDWMDRRKALDLDVASEFVTMAAHLVYIKTRMLLSINDEEAMSEMEQLIASLEEHQRQESYLKIKAVAPQLGNAISTAGTTSPRVPSIFPSTSSTAINTSQTTSSEPSPMCWSGWTTTSRPRWPPLRASWAGSPTR